MRQNSLLFRALQFYGNKFPSHRGKWWIHLQLRNIFKANLNIDIKAVHNGLTWLLNPSDYVQSEFFWLGEKDSWEIYHINKILKSGDVIFDVGANFGYYSIKIVNILNKNCKVFAFEPNPRTYIRLVKNIELNNYNDVITAQQTGLGDSEEAANIIANINNSGGSYINENGKGEKVPITTLDKYCRQNCISQISFIKIDVEGFEEKVLLGAAESIAKFKPVILIELNPTTLRRQESSIAEIVNILKRYGYQLFIPCRNKLVPLKNMSLKHGYIDTFCFPKSD